MNKTENTQAGVSKPRYSEQEKKQVMSDLYKTFNHDDELFVRFLMLKLPNMTEERAQRILRDVWIYDIEKDMGVEGIIVVVSFTPDSNQKSESEATTAEG